MNLYIMLPAREYISAARTSLDLYDALTAQPAAMCISTLHNIFFFDLEGSFGWDDENQQNGSGWG
jgi:hypothetical protein